MVLFSAERAENKTLHALWAASPAVALTFHGGAGEFGDRRDTREMTYEGDARNIWYGSPVLFCTEEDLR